MQNSLNKERNVVEFTSPKVATDVIKGTSAPNSEFMSQISMLNIQAEQNKTAQIKPLKTSTVYVIKKDGTKEEFDSKKIINAVKKSATRMLVELSETELKEICDFVDNNILRMNKSEVSIISVTMRYIWINMFQSAFHQIMHVRNRNF